MSIIEGKEEEQGLESIFRQIVDENFPNLRCELELGNQEVNRTPHYLNPKKTFSKTHCIKIIKNQRQRKNSQGSQRKEEGNI